MTPGLKEFANFHLELSFCTNLQLVMKFQLDACIFKRKDKIMSGALTLGIRV